ncbi:hypothetical protein BC834DRAFT_240898 [Gloeopeniophorella convolvens]|nr:hypothetical protein BC834DRAFT_240898 [Gloeopeniophorella convolvens]
MHARRGFSSCMIGLAGVIFSLQRIQSSRYETGLQTQSTFASETPYTACGGVTSSLSLQHQAWRRDERYARGDPQGVQYLGHRPIEGLVGGTQRL